MAGKRAKCKACGNVFRIAGAATESKNRPRAGTKTKSVPTATEPLAALPAATDLGIAGAFTRPVTAPLSPAAARLARQIKLLSWIQLRWWMLLVFLCFAIVIGLSADRWPGLWNLSLWLFPLLACVFLILGLAYSSARALIANNDEKIAAGDVALINFQFAMVVFLRLRTLAYRRTILRSDQYQKFYRQMLGTMLRALCLAGMSGAVLAAKSVSRSMPSLDSAQRAVQNFFDDSHHRKPHAGGDAESP
jgi:hypothetical protein